MPLKEVPSRARSSSPLALMRSLRLPSAKQLATAAARRTGVGDEASHDEGDGADEQDEAAATEEERLPDEADDLRSRSIG